MDKLDELILIEQFKYRISKELSHDGGLIFDDSKPDYITYQAIKNSKSNCIRKKDLKRKINTEEDAKCQDEAID